MPFRPVSKIHFTYDPGSSILPDALEEARIQVAGLGGITMTVVEFIDGSVVDVDSLPYAGRPITLGLGRDSDGDWWYRLSNSEGTVSANACSVKTAFDTLLNFVFTNGGPNYALLDNATGVVL